MTEDILLTNDIQANYEIKGGIGSGGGRIRGGGGIVRGGGGRVGNSGGGIRLGGCVV